MLRHMALVRADVSEEPSASQLRVTRIGGLGTKVGLTGECSEFISFYHPDDGSARFLRNVGSYKSHMV
jgi:hypothetical protein